MKFGRVPTARAVGLITAHTLRAGSLTLRKGSRLRPEHLHHLQEAGLDEVVAASLEPGDIGEDEAASHLAERIAGDGLRREPAFTGRCNLFAGLAGLLLVERAGIDAINGVDEAITVATLAPFRPVAADEMVATVKIIPYAVPGPVLAMACAAVREPPLRIAPYRRRRVGVVSTLLPGLKPATVDKTLRNLRHRLAPTGAAVIGDVRIPHEPGAVAEAVATLVEQSGADLVLIFGASAIADRRDVIPMGIEAAGGHVVHLGMPVDPGNLLLVGARGDVPVIGAPGCARSPKENGFDWVLQRHLADLAVARSDIVAMGVGGLLTEIVSRPQPRDGGERADDDA
ncbi:molybdopterin-binding protein [Methylobacterium sp. Leaf399]|uniref:molybdopterin-binding protein n=1 Tax=Methylobacterium sp. Leaf399 TaxID=1736364 RepID=UPI0006F85EB0|nr:molybdopterin-binding protein [Methylobacterium sp. Leaf399]KQT19484.1 molybdopterin-binding protein [Methylobacterium sp. Leaf399]